MKRDVQSRRRALERGLIRVRWFGVAFAFFQIYMNPEPDCAGTFIPTAGGCQPYFLKPLGYGLAVGLGVINILLTLWLRRKKESENLSSIGATAFMVDHLFLFSFAWLYSFTEFTQIWIVIYILPLEGALRYGMAGALASFAITSGAEVLREYYRNQAFGFPFQLVPATSFRLGILAIIASIVGLMARNLERERRAVEEHALQMEELASTEAAARQEAQAFHQGTIAGVSTGDFKEAMERMCTTVAQTLGYDSLSIALIEELEGQEPLLRLIAGYHYPREAVGLVIEMDEGICGPVAATGEAALVSDVTDHPGYLEFAPWCRSEMAAPLKVGDRVIGVLNCESPRPAAFDQDALDQLVRLAEALSVVVENARVLAREKEAVERLTELDVMKSDFIAISSHELRTPLTAIRGFVKTLMRAENLSDEQRREYLGVLDRQTDKLSSSIEDLLFISQAERGQISMRYSTFAISSMLQDCLGTFGNDAGRIELIGDIESIIVKTDRERLQRGIEAVIDNALRFSPAGSTVSLETRKNEDGNIEVLISDHGVGIAASELGKIFDRFYQVGGSMRRLQGGFGLGLYITKKVLEALGGDIAVRSEPGGGATFTIRIPAEAPSWLRQDQPEAPLRSS